MPSTVASVVPAELRLGTRAVGSDRAQQSSARHDSAQPSSAQPSSTRQESARQDQARLEVLLGALACGVLLVDADGRIVATNAALPETLDIGLEADELPGMRLDELASTPACRHVAHALLPSAGRGGHGERSALRSTGEVNLPNGRVLEYVRRPVALDGESIGQLTVYRAISDHGAARNQLRRRNRALAELAALKTDFVAGVSHELRTPLTAILAFAEILGQGAAGTIGIGEAAGAIERNAERLLCLVDDLVLLANLGSGVLPLESVPVDASGLLAGAVERWRAGAAERDVTLRCRAASGAVVAGDARWLGQLFDTLVAVAVAATAPGGVAELVAEADPAGWRIRVPAPGGSTEADGGTDQLFAEVGPMGAPGRGASMALMLGRAIVGRHQGTMTTGRDGGRGEIVVWLPLADG